MVWCYWRGRLRTARLAGPLPSPRGRTHRARAVLPQDTFQRVSFHRYPFHGIIFTLSRYSEKRMAAPSFPLFSAWRGGHELPLAASVSASPVPRYVWRSPCFASSRRALGLEARACGVQRSPPRSTTCDRGRPSSSTRRGALAALGVQFLPTFPCGGLLRLLRR